MARQEVAVLEQGDIYFFYQPKVELDRARSDADVQRFYVVLSPHGKSPYRLLVVGRKRLPDPARHERFWGFVDRVETSAARLRESLAAAQYDTRTRGHRTVPAARAAGEGVYELVRRGRETFLAYLLELPEQPGEVQRDLGIERRASFVVSVKNPAAGSPRRARLSAVQQADFPRALLERFHGRRFVPADPVEFLDHPGAELVIVGSTERPQQQLGTELPAEHESEESAEIFSDLKLRREQNPVKPLFSGRWE